MFLAIRNIELNVCTCTFLNVVNSIQWAPHEWGLVLACASSDESFSILYTTGKYEYMYMYNLYMYMSALSGLGGGGGRGPHEWELVLACASSDELFSILYVYCR